MNTIPRQLIESLRASRHLVILTGSGVSAESGIPTFRGKQSGLWSRFRPEDLATPQAFARDPSLVWNWYQWRRELVGKAKPNAAHLAIAVLENRLPQMTLITQNVDGLHQRAGSSNALEFHGNIHRNRCSDDRCGQPADVAPGAGLPRCAVCGAPVRPGVVWFGESIAPDVLLAARTAAETCDVFIAVGTSAIVQPAAGLCERAGEAGAVTVEINTEETPASSRVDFALRGKAGEIVPVLLSAIS